MPPIECNFPCHSHPWAEGWTQDKHSTTELKPYPWSTRLWPRVILSWRWEEAMQTYPGGNEHRFLSSIKQTVKWATWTKTPAYTKLLSTKCDIAYSQWKNQGSFKQLLSVCWYWLVFPVLSQTRVTWEERLQLWALFYPLTSWHIC